MNKINYASFKYDNAAVTAKPGYLHRKWTWLFPGWNKPLKPQPRLRWYR